MVVRYIIVYSIIKTFQCKRKIKLFEYEIKPKKYYSSIFIHVHLFQLKKIFEVKIGTAIPFMKDIYGGAYFQLRVRPMY